MDLFKFFVPKPFRPAIELAARERWRKHATVFGYKIDLKWDRHFTLTAPDGNVLHGEITGEVKGREIEFANHPDMKGILATEHGAWFGSRTPLHVFMVDDEPFYFHNGVPISHDSVLATLGELPRTLTDKHQQLYGFNAPSWYDQHVGVQLKDLFGLDPIDILALLGQKNGPCVTEKVRLEKVGGYHVFLNPHTLYFQWNHSAKSFVFCVHDGLAVYRNVDTKIFTTTAPDVYSLFYDDPKACIFGILRQDFQRMGMTPYTGITIIDGKEVFYLNGEVVADEIVYSILDDVPVKFTDEQVMALTLSL